MEQRLQFVREFKSELFTMTELAAQYGVSRKTGYKWLERYEADGVLGLQDRSRRPHHSPHATATEVIDALVRLRQLHPRWGPKKLLAVATPPEAEGNWPSPSTVPTHLNARGSVSGRRRLSTSGAGRNSFANSPPLRM
jgi:putative transposase